ncbi:hypothetical protein SAMN05421780_1139 [Flexibacter flexilis DSM 6793]|uniref:Uncharacterized protein n=1 Tax=Flexibacter flexilis DSM 6793 TaxID=927664 RepID=A0A1I1N678_9BACT|nr:hypothetical protein [Flexibacter flexilis]SFC93194.1 hypothetical protein SAMN05421780_1139 [Flexibacter flexilis DSM 6793]
MEDNGFYLEGKFYPCPKNYQELTRDQLIKIYELLMSEAPYTDVVVAIIPVLFRLHMNLELLRFFMTKVTPVEWVDLALLTDPFIQNPESCINLLPTVCVDEKQFVGPADTLANLSFAEFINADTHFLRFLQTQDESHLNALCATLYRPQREDFNPDAPDTNGDPREVFNDNLVATRAQTFATLLKGEKAAILYFFMGCRNEIEKQYPWIFKKTDEEKTESEGWVGVWLQMAGNKFGDAEKTANTNLHWILTELNIMMRNYFETKSKTQQ